jgi:hypothetical protein
MATFLYGLGPDAKERKMRTATVLSCLAAIGALLASPGSVSALPETPPLTLSTEDGRTSITVGLAAQLRFEYNDLDKGPGKDREDTETIFFRRIRPAIKGTLLTKNLSYALQLNLVPGSLELIDLYASYAFITHFQVLIGQAKLPFTRHRLVSFKDLSFAEWSNETKFFGAERQVGMMFHNGWDKPSAFEYELGVYTGDNARASNAIGISKAFGLTPENPSNLVEPAAPTGFHPELALHLGYNYGGISLKEHADLQGGPPRFSVGVSTSWDIRPTLREDYSLRLAPEFWFKVHGFSFVGVFYAAFWEAEDNTLSSTSLANLGAVLQASQFFLDRFEVAFRYTEIYFAENLRDAARQFGDAEIAAAVAAGDDAEAVAALTDQYKTNGKVDNEHDLTLGFNVYFFGKALKWQTDASLLLHSRVDDDRKDARVRTQLQIAF